MLNHSYRGDPGRNERAVPARQLRERPQPNPDAPCTNPWVVPRRRNDHRCADAVLCYEGKPDKVPRTACVEGLRAVPSNTLASIEVASELTTTTYGEVVGQNLYQMANDWGFIRVAYGWSGLRADGTEIEADTCRILVTITGPESLPSERYGRCTNLDTSFFDASENELEISVPGTYQVTVLDETTGVSGVGTFDILGE